MPATPGTSLSLMVYCSHLLQRTQVRLQGVIQPPKNPLLLWEQFFIILRARHGLALCTHSDSMCAHDANDSSRRRVAAARIMFNHRPF